MEKGDGGEEEEEGGGEGIVGLGFWDFGLWMCCGGCCGREAVRERRREEIWFFVLAGRQDETSMARSRLLLW